MIHISIIATIKQHRLDLLTNVETKADPIDLEVPQHVTDKFSTGKVSAREFYIHNDIHAIF